MHLSSKDAKRFFTVWFKLLHYVNQRQKLVPTFPKEWRNGGVQPRVALPLRNALWADDSLRDAFIAENPYDLSRDDLSLVHSWKRRVSGDFFVFRYLKKYTVFIDDKSLAHVYGVLGITGPLDEILGPYLPQYVTAVLIPFEDRIIYDSLMSGYAISFGGGIKRILKDTYDDARKHDGVITALPHD